MMHIFTTVGQWFLSTNPLSVPTSKHAKQMPDRQPWEQCKWQQVAV